MAIKSISQLDKFIINEDIIPSVWMQYLNCNETELSAYLDKRNAESLFEISELQMVDSVANTDINFTRFLSKNITVADLGKLISDNIAKFGFLTLQVHHQLSVGTLSAGENEVQAPFSVKTECVRTSSLADFAYKYTSGNKQTNENAIQNGTAKYPFSKYVKLQNQTENAILFDPDPSHHLSVVTAASFNNTVDFHQPVTHHNKLVLYRDCRVLGNDNLNNTVLSGITGIRYPGYRRNPDTGLPECKDENNIYIDGTTKYYDCSLSCHGEARFDDVVIVNDDIVCRELYGTAQRARFADVAEKYIADNEYEPGTLVCFAGDAEITVATDTVNAVVTSKPGVLLNTVLDVDNENTFACAIALTGRVPVRVVGPVKKFDKLVLSKDIPGVACVDNSSSTSGSCIARALETNENEDVKLVLAVTQLSLD